MARAKRVPRTQAFVQAHMAANSKPRPTTQGEDEINRKAIKQAQAELNRNPRRAVRQGVTFPRKQRVELPEHKPKRKRTKPGAKKTTPRLSMDNGPDNYFVGGAMQDETSSTSETEVIHFEPSTYKRQPGDQFIKHKGTIPTREGWDKYQYSMANVPKEYRVRIRYKSDYLSNERDLRMLYPALKWSTKITANDREGMVDQVRKSSFLKYIRIVKPPKKVDELAKTQLAIPTSHPEYGEHEQHIVLEYWQISEIYETQMGKNQKTPHDWPEKYKDDVISWIKGMYWGGKVTTIQYTIMLKKVGTKNAENLPKITNQLLLARQSPNQPGELGKTNKIAGKYKGTIQTIYKQPTAGGIDKCYVQRKERVNIKGHDEKVITIKVPAKPPKTVHVPAHVKVIPGRDAYTYQRKIKAKPDRSYERIVKRPVKCTGAAVKDAARTDIDLPNIPDDQNGNFVWEEPIPKRPRKPRPATKN